LRSAKSITLNGCAFGCFDAPSTTPAKAVAGAKAMHLFTGMMDSAAVAKKRLCHGDLAVKVIWCQQNGGEWFQENDSAVTVCVQMRCQQAKKCPAAPGEGEKLVKCCYRFFQALSCSSWLVFSVCIKANG
jgi:hypothetical protein